MDCSVELVPKLLGLLTTNIIKEKIHKHGTGSTARLLNNPLQERHGPSPIIIVNILCCSKNTLSILVELPQKTMPYFTKE
jgi:hypothetical protein